MQPVCPIKKCMADRAVYATKSELLLFLYFLDTNPIIQKFLQYDSTFRLADKYLIAMVFIYFKRAQLGPDDYTYLNFFAGLCLAHSMEEDIELSSEIYPWALGSELKSELPKLLELKTLLWVGMDYRAAVSQYCCNQDDKHRNTTFLKLHVNAPLHCIVCLHTGTLAYGVKAHPIWQRERRSCCVTELLSAEKENDFHVPAKLCANSKKKGGNNRKGSPNYERKFLLSYSPKSD